MSACYPSLTKMIHVTDDWYPCCSGHRVRVTLTSIMVFRNEYYVILNAWGRDDTGVEMRYASPSSIDVAYAYLKFKSVFDSIHDGVDRDWFLSNGFQRA